MKDQRTMDTALKGNLILNLPSSTRPLALPFSENENRQCTILGLIITTKYICHVSTVSQNKVTAETLI